MWSDEQYQQYSWNEWITSNGNLPPLRANISLTSGTDVAVHIGAIYDMSCQGDAMDASGVGVGKGHAVADGRGAGPATRLQILNNMKVNNITVTFFHASVKALTRKFDGRKLHCCYFSGFQLILCNSLKI